MKITADNAVVDGGDKTDALRAAFPYMAEYTYTDRDGQTESELLFDGTQIQVTEWVTKVTDSVQAQKPYNDAGDVRTIYSTEKTGKTSRSIAPDDDLTNETQRVKDFAAIVFDSTFMAEWQAEQDRIAAEKAAEEEAARLKAEAEALNVEVVEPTEPTPEEIAAMERAKIVKEYQDTINALRAGYTDEEVLTFDQKRREADIILDGLDKATPLIDALGGDRVEIAKAIIAKADHFAKIAGEAEAVRDQKLSQKPLGSG